MIRTNPPPVSHSLATQVDRDGRRTIVRLEIEGRLVGLATVSLEESGHSIQFSLGHGGVPREVRSSLVDAAFRAVPPELGDELRISLPLGDPDLLSDIGSHTRSARRRAAGASCLIEATLEVADDALAERAVADEDPSAT